MGKQTFNIIRFLDLPLEIRKSVYYHLDGIFTDSNPPKVAELYNSDIIELPQVRKEYGSKKRKHYFKALVKRYYPIFRQYLHNFQYSPFLIETWLEYSQWLRYDAIVLDCLRLNHLYDGSLIGPLDWIILDGRPKVAFFNDLLMLQVWYSFQEFRTLVLQSDKDDASIEKAHYMRLSLENQDHNGLRLLFLKFKETGRFNMISEVFLGNGNFTSTINHAKSFNDSIEISAKRIRTPDTEQIVTREERHQIPEDDSILLLIENLDNMKALSKIGVRGPSLFEAILNTHGVRDNPGQTISYLTRRQIKSMLISQVGNPSATGIADFNKWVNLKEIILENCGTIDLNTFVIPPNVIRLIIRNARRLHWWNFDSIEDIIKYHSSEALIEYKLKSLRLSEPRCFELDKTNVPLETQKLIRNIVWTSLGALNFICMSDILNTSKKNIFVPKSLYADRRILIFGCNINKLILI